MENCPLKTERKLKKEDGGASDHYVSENGLLVMKWCDDKELIVASNHYSAEPTFPVRRWDKKKKVYVNVDLPALIRAYNKGMGGVDFCDQWLSYYRFDLHFFLTFFVYYRPFVILKCILFYADATSNLRHSK